MSQKVVTVSEEAHARLKEIKESDAFPEVDTFGDAVDTLLDAIGKSNSAYASLRERFGDDAEPLTDLFNKFIDVLSETDLLELTGDHIHMSLAVDDLLDVGMDPNQVGDIKGRLFACPYCTNLTLTTAEFPKFCAGCGNGVRVTALVTEGPPEEHLAKLLMETEEYRQIAEGWRP